jgi:hypothetical protein
MIALSFSPEEFHRVQEEGSNLERAETPESYSGHARTGKQLPRAVLPRLPPSRSMHPLGVSLGAGIRVSASADDAAS